MPFDERKQQLMIYGLRIVGWCVGAVIVALGLYFLVTDDTSSGDINDQMKNTVLDVYRVIFGLLIMLAELRLRHLLVWFSFLLYYIGLGLFYVFVGGLALGTEWYEIVVGIVACCVGFGYCFLACACSSVEKAHQSQYKADVQAAQM